jgi:hypothetical protein
LHDEATYGPNTDEFIPERWLTDDGRINTAMRDPSAAFGFGRRICPVRHVFFFLNYTTHSPSASDQGRDMAQWSIWICTASILATFNISKSVDEKGVPIQPSGEYTSGLLWWVFSRLRTVVNLSSSVDSYPVPHSCDILPRSEAARALIRTALQN